MSEKSVKPPKSDRFARIKQSFIKNVRDRFFLRFHMLLILAATILSGSLFSKLLLLVHVDNIVLRYPLAVLLSYAAFFLFVKLWLYYMTVYEVNKQETTANILSNIPDPSGISASSSDVQLFSGGGGTSGGGGVSASLDGSSQISRQALDAVPSASEGSSSGIADAAGNAVSGIFDDDGVILVVIGVLLATIFGSSLYLIYNAPHILSDAAFNFLLASSLIRGYKVMTKPDWIGSVFKSTFLPFFIVLAVSFGAAWIIHARYPQLTKLSDVLVPLVKELFL
jgi:hypothetical protein